MYNKEIVKERIKNKATEQGRSVRSVLMSCNINTSYLAQLEGNKDMKVAYLYKIADELECSTDYLLGRADV